MRPIKILYLDHAPLWGGAEIVLANLLRRLDPTRFTPWVATREGSPFFEMRKNIENIEVEILTAPFGRLNQAGASSPVNLARAVWSVTRIVRQHQVNIIHSNTVRTHIVGSLAAALSQTPIVWTLHDNTFPVNLARWLAPIPVRVIAVSNWLRNLYGPAGLSEKMVVIPNGIHLPVSSRTTDDLRREFKIPLEAPVALHVGRLVAGKAPHMFIEAAQRVSQVLPQAYFILVGGPDPLRSPLRGRQIASAYADKLAQAVRDSELGNRLILAGHHPDVKRFYEAADVIVYCAVQPEGLPTVLIEAAAHGKPVVASEIGGAPEIVEPNVTGLLTPPGNVDALAAAMLGLLRNSSKAQALGAAARLRAEERYTVERMAAQVMTVYDEITVETRPVASLQRIN